MELGSTSLSTIACSDHWNSTIRQACMMDWIEHAFLMNCVDIGYLAKAAEFIAYSDRENRYLFLDKLIPGPVKTLIWQAIEQFQVKVFKSVVFSEESFTSRWPIVVSEESFTSKWPIVVSAVVLLSFVYLYLIGYIDRGGSKAGSSGSLDFRDIYISILLFQAAYVWIKFRDVISGRPLYQRPGSSKWEPRIKFPVRRGMGGTSKRIPLGSYDTEAEGEVAYEIAAFYCKKRKHTGRLDLGGGAYFPIPALSLDPNLPYEEQVKQVGDQVLNVYAEFEERKASRNLPRSVPELAMEIPTGEGQLLATSPSQQLGQPLHSGMVSAIQGQGSQLDRNIHNGVDFNNLGSLRLVLLKTQQELLDAHKQNECLKAQVAQTEFENMAWEVKYSELKRENGLLEHQIMQSKLETLRPEQEFDTNIFLNMGHEDSLAR